MVTRRRFLVGTAAGAGAALLGGPAAVAAPALPAAPAAPAVAAASLPLLTGPFPRAFSFRQCEGLAETWSYPDWAAAIGRLGGVMGKVLQEEKTVWSGPRQLAYLARFARENPSQAVLLHYNGRARRPGYRPAGWTAADFLHRAGTTLLDPLGAADTVLRVADPGAFDLQPDLLGSLTDDVVVTGRTAAGTPDWSVAEQVVLTGVDAAAGTITVQRAAYGSAALDLPAGAYVAQHLTKGPWTAIDTRVWLLNLAPNAPRGPDGRSAAERIAAEMAADFGRTGPLNRFHGVQLDIFQLYPSERAVVDADGDGVVDGAMVGDVDTYTQGQVGFTARLHAAIGRSRLLLVDGAVGQRPDLATVDGIEEEGFPTVLDTGPAKWSQGYDALVATNARTRSTHLSYVVAKSRGTTAQGFPRFRSALAATLLTDSAVTFWDQVDDGDPADPTGFPIWDELLGGAGGTAGWLGAPAGATQRPVLAGRDLLGGAGTALRQDWVDRWVVTGGSVSRRNGAVWFAPTGTDGVVVWLPPLPAAGPDLVVRLDGRADPAPGLPATVGRILTVTTAVGRARPANDLGVAGAWRTVTSAASGLPDGTVSVGLAVPDHAAWAVRAIAVFAGADVAARLFERGAVFANPSATPQSFDVASLFPGVGFARLVASAGQDPVVNDGSAIGATLTVPAYDALVVRRV